MPRFLVESEILNSPTHRGIFEESNSHAAVIVALVEWRKCKLGKSLVVSEISEEEFEFDVPGDHNADVDKY